MSLSYITLIRATLEKNIEATGSESFKLSCKVSVELPCSFFVIGGTAIMVYRNCNGIGLILTGAIFGLPLAHLSKAELRFGIRPQLV